MPNTHATLSDLFSDIADAIRLKDGSVGEIVADNFPNRINAIVTDPTTDATISSNGQLLDGVTAYGQGHKYTGNIPIKAATDITASGDTVTIPAGYYYNTNTKSIDSGSATTPVTTITSNPTITVDNNGLITATHSSSQSITPTVVAGYVSSGTSGTVSTTGSATEQLNTLSATTYNTSNSDRTITAGQFLTGAQTIKAVTTDGLVEGNIRAGAFAKVGDEDDDDRIVDVTGTFSASNTITGTGKSAASAGEILTGKSAFLDGAQLDGTMPNNGATGTTITTQGGTYTIPAGYTSGGTVTANIAAGTITNAIIESCVMNHPEVSGDEDTARVTVTVPTGYHTQTTVVKDFTDLLPGLDQGAANSQILDGYQAYDDSGAQITGVMTNNNAVTHTITSQNGTYTVPNGYHNGQGVITATINNVTGSIGGSASAGSASAAIANTDSMRVVTSPSGTAGTDYFRVKATASGSAGSYTPKYTVTTGGYIGSDVTGAAQSVSVTSDTTGQTLNIPKATFTVDGAAVKTTSTGGGYVKDSTTVGTVSSMTLPTAATSSATSGYTSKATVSRSTADQYINIPVGYNAAGAYYKINATANGSATTPATSVTAGVADSSSVASATGLVTIVTKAATKSVTPTVSAGYIDSGTAGTITVPSSTYTYQLPTTKGATTYNTSSTDQSIAAGTYLTGAQTIKAVTTAGISAGNIKEGVVIKVGDANDDDRIISVTGTLVEGGKYTTFAIAGTETWTSDSTSGGVYHDFTVNGVTTSSNPVLDPVISSASTVDAINSAWATVFKATTPAANTIRLFATAAITTAMVVGVKGY